MRQRKIFYKSFLKSHHCCSLVMKLFHGKYKTVIFLRNVIFLYPEKGITSSGLESNKNSIKLSATDEIVCAGNANNKEFNLTHVLSDEMSKI